MRAVRIRIRLWEIRSQQQGRVAHNLLLRVPCQTNCPFSDSDRQLPSFSSLQQPVWPGGSGSEQSRSQKNKKNTGRFQSLLNFIQVPSWAIDYATWPFKECLQILISSSLSLRIPYPLLCTHLDAACFNDVHKPKTTARFLIFLLS
jgi:hypothetical protein